MKRFLVGILYLVFIFIIIFLVNSGDVYAVSCGSCSNCDCCGSGTVYCGAEGVLGYKLGNGPSCGSDYVDERFLCYGGTWYECDPDQDWTWSPLISASDNQKVGNLYCCFDDSQWGHWDFSSCDSGSVAPNGHFGDVNCERAGGWTKDPDIEGAISVHFYASEDQGTMGNFVGSQLADVYREDLCDIPTIGCNHAFHFILPDSLKDGKTYWMRVYAIDVDENGALTGNNPELGGSPIQFGPCYPNPEFNPSQGQPISVPPPYTIQSSDGHVTVGMNRRYGGAIVYYNDSRITDTTVAQGNIIDYSNAGTLFTTAIWTLPPNSSEQHFCYDGQKVGGVCPGTIPFNNPTQGGYRGNGYAGNPNAVEVTFYETENRINVSCRPVNYNFAYHTSFRGSDPREPFPLESNKEEWQTDFWHDIEIYFHPNITDVLVIETKVTYCKDMDDDCKNKTIVTQDNQLNTLFAAGGKHPDPNFRGPYNRTAYHRQDGFVYLKEQKKITDNDEEWVAILKEDEDVGIGVSIQHYQPTNMTRHGINVGTWPSFTHTQPELNLFENSGITRKESVVVDGVTYSDIVRYEFDPGGWYKFRTYVATGSLIKIRDDLLNVTAVKKRIYFDADEDGYGNASVYIEFYDPPLTTVQWVNNSLDCNDSNAYINPGMQEIFYNGLDDDCDSSTKDELDGDVDQNSVVNIDDLIMVSSRLGQTEQHQDWDGTADVVSDGEIDIYDLVFVARNFT